MMSDFNNFTRITHQHFFTCVTKFVTFENCQNFPQSSVEDNSRYKKYRRTCRMNGVSSYYTIHSCQVLLSGRVNTAGGRDEKYSLARASSANILLEGTSCKTRLARSPAREDGYRLVRRSGWEGRGGEGREGRGGGGEKGGKKSGEERREEGGN